VGVGIGGGGGEGGEEEEATFSGIMKAMVLVCRGVGDVLLVNGLGVTLVVGLLAAGDRGDIPRHRVDNHDRDTAIGVERGARLGGEM
jgi:hypothetical protein